MKIAIASDIHSNLPALEKFLELTQDCDQRWNLGDVVGYGPWPLKCAKIAKSEFDVSIQGNHDRVIGNEQNCKRFNSMARSGAKFAINVLDDEHKEWLSNLPEKKALSVNSDQIELAHSHPINTDKYVKPEEFESLRDYMSCKFDKLFIGHTHIQAKKQFEEGIITNPGSVGQPRDGNAYAAYAILEDSKIELKRFDYDKSEYVEQVRQLGLPRRTGQRLFTGR
jgi:putative phosphoesterase